MTDKTERRAVVLGASMVGLLAARALAERYDRVSVVDRVQLPSAAAHRPGVPHNRHLHGLHPRGLPNLDRLFPELPGSGIRGPHPPGTGPKTSRPVGLPGYGPAGQVWGRVTDRTSGHRSVPV